MPPNPSGVDKDGIISSARQRRRKIKQHQEGHSKVVLKPHCSADDPGVLHEESTAKHHQQSAQHVGDTNQQQKQQQPSGQLNIIDDMGQPQHQRSDQHVGDMDSDETDAPSTRLDPSDEVDEFYILLNSTLHLPDTEPEDYPADAGGGEPQLLSGRLEERAKVLRQ